MKFCIIGLGHFGVPLARDLAAEGHEVVAIDRKMDPVDSLRDVVTVAARADAADIEVLKELGVKECDAAVVAIGEDFEASLVATAHLKELEIPQIYCRVLGPVHERLIDLLGVTEKIQPEAVAARQFAKRLGIRRATRHFDISEDYAIAEVTVPEELVGKSLAEANLRNKHGLNIVTIRRKKGDSDSAEILGVPEPSVKFTEGDQLLVFARNASMKAFAGKFSRSDKS